MAESNIVTGQYVRISQTPASIGTRIVAQLIDGFVVACYVVGIAQLLINFEIYFDETLYYILMFLPAVFYSFLFEVFNNGRSLGKMAMHTKVVKIDGSSPTIGDYFMRWLLRIIDVHFMGVGIVSILLSKNSQRLGDIAAGTMVISQKNYHKIQVSLDEFTYLERNYKPVYAQAEDLTLNQLDIIQRTLNAEYNYEREMRINKLAEKVRQALRIPNDNVPNEKFLYTIVRDYQHYSLEII
ncbi:RDD family protein [Prevotella sp. HUN102]|uniref:RDD family protein n=1 Tax=Prevotella sp. HUN102 TaxID=1392486 RepID=UPI00048B7A04|nr:RDD family protein [Prevotella sp. HUN102]